MYDLHQTPYQNMERFHNDMNYVKKWAVYSLLQYTYAGTYTLRVDEVQYLSWEQLLTQADREWCVSPAMYAVIQTFSQQYIPHISYEEFEGFVMCKIFLQCILEENVKRIVLMCGHFKHLALFLKGIELLYSQQFNIAKVKLLFSRIFFPHIYDKFKHDRGLQFDICHVLANKVDNGVMTIGLKRLQPYVKDIRDNTILTIDKTMVAAVAQFHSGEIITVPEFYAMCETFKTLSRGTPHSLKRLRDIFMTNEDINTICNKLNRLYANILLIVVLKQKEETANYHNLLYSDLQTILVGLNVY